MDRLLWDCRYALRQIRRTPGYALAAVATLALAIGANAAVFSLVNALVFKPLPVRDPGQLAVLQAASERVTWCPADLPKRVSAIPQQLIHCCLIGRKVPKL